MFVCKNVFKYVCACMHVCLYAYMYVNMCVYVCMFVCVFACVCVLLYARCGMLKKMYFPCTSSLPDEGCGGLME